MFIHHLCDCLLGGVVKFLSVWFVFYFVFICFFLMQHIVALLVWLIVGTSAALYLTSACHLMFRLINYLGLNYLCVLLGGVVNFPSVVVTKFYSPMSHVDSSLVCLFVGRSCQMPIRVVRFLFCFYPHRLMQHVLTLLMWLIVGTSVFLHVTSACFEDLMFGLINHLGLKWFLMSEPLVCCISL